MKNSNSDDCFIPLHKKQNEHDLEDRDNKV